MSGRRPSAGIIAYIALIFAVAMVLGLIPSGCTSTPAAPPCTSCVGPYDLTLSSHRDAVLGHP